MTLCQTCNHYADRRCNIPLGVALVVFIVGGLYTWARYEQGARATAEASLAESERNLATVQNSLADLVATNKVMDVALSNRDTEHQETQERLRSASTELSQLRRQNAELRDWLDRPIPADVVRLLQGATRGADRKAVPAKDPSR